MRAEHRGGDARTPAIVPAVAIAFPGMAHSSTDPHMRRPRKTKGATVRVARRFAGLQWTVTAR
jgi:hypothetical protein